MDEVVAQVFTYKTVILMIAVVIGTFFVRRIIETAFPQVKQASSEMSDSATYTNHWAAWWNQVFLYLIPVLLGAAMAFMFKDIVSLDTFTSKTGLALYGAIAGWFSATGYKVIRRLVQTKTGVELPAVSTMPEVAVKVEAKPEGAKIEVKVEAKPEPPPEPAKSETPANSSPEASSEETPAA